MASIALCLDVSLNSTRTDSDKALDPSRKGCRCEAGAMMNEGLRKQEG